MDKTCLGWVRKTCGRACVQQYSWVAPPPPPPGPMGCTPMITWHKQKNIKTYKTITTLKRRSPFINWIQRSIMPCNKLCRLLRKLSNNVYVYCSEYACRIHSPKTTLCSINFVFNRKRFSPETTHPSWKRDLMKQKKGKGPFISISVKCSLTTTRLSNLSLVFCFPAWTRFNFSGVV